MTIKEIAELCGVKEVKTIYNWIDRIESLNVKITLRNKIDNGSPENPADFTLEETLAIIGDGGGNKTLAVLLEENAANKNALTLHNGNPITQQISRLTALMSKVEKALECPQKNAYEELESWVLKTIEIEERPIYKVYVHELYHAYKKEINKPLNEHNFKFQIALDHPEFEPRRTREGDWYFSYCSKIRSI